MARPKIPTINWRSELAQLDRFLKKDGGVVHIRISSDSPSVVFAKALRSRMTYEPSGMPWQTIQIDGDNAATHYLVDIIDQFERTLGIDSGSTINTNTTVTIASNIEAGGDVEIGDINVHISNSGGMLHDRAEKINATLSKLLKDQRMAIFIFEGDEDNSRELSAFRSVLWDKRLENWVPNGLLLIAFIGHKGGVPNWLPDADEVIDLPTLYSDESARNAIEDLKNFFISRELLATEGEAIAVARTMVASNPKPKELHANFAATLSNMEKWR